MRDCKPTSPSKNAGPRRLHSSTTVAANSTPSQALQTPLKTSHELINHPWKAQKRKYAAENEHSQKRLLIDAPSVSVPAAASQDLISVRQASNDFEDKHLHERRRVCVPESQLSEENLKKLERDLQKLDRGTPSDMDSSVIVPDRVLKRGPSRQASLSDLNQDTASLRSQKSSISNSFYRYDTLYRAKMYIGPEPPPMDIQAQMDVIFEREIPAKRKKEISDVAKNISQSFINKLRGAHREDDLVELIYKAFLKMNMDETFDFSRKAGILLPLIPLYPLLSVNFDLDWNPSLKPQLQESWNLNAFDQFNNDADDVIDRPNKRQQGKRSFPSLDTPPATSSQPKLDAVKTPRPDFTIGFRHSTISKALIQRGLSKYKADDFLDDLQLGGKLYSDPTQNFLKVRFPILVIEGKAYATGKTAFEAQNQAVVSGSCMVNLRQQFIDFVENTFSIPKGGKTPLAFSICTEGPHIEFWVHYALMEDNVRRHYMNIFRTCYGSLQCGLEGFLMDMERLMRWTEDEFLTEVADQLYELAKHAEQE